MVQDAINYIRVSLGKKYQEIPFHTPKRKKLPKFAPTDITAALRSNGRDEKKEKKLE